jgi:hypothetical protein
MFPPPKTHSMPDFLLSNCTFEFKKTYVALQYTYFEKERTCLTPLRRLLPPGDPFWMGKHRRGGNPTPRRSYTLRHLTNISCSIQPSRFWQRLAKSQLVTCSHLVGASKMELTDQDKSGFKHEGQPYFQEVRLFFLCSLLSALCSLLSLCSLVSALFT